MKQPRGKKNIAGRDTRKQSGAGDAQKITDRSGFAFDKDSYKWLLIGMVLLLVGFLLMIGGGSDNPDVFNKSMFDFQRLTLSPILLMVGYMFGIYAIIKKPKDSNRQPE